MDNHNELFDEDTGNNVPWRKIDEQLKTACLAIKTTGFDLGVTRDEIALALESETTDERQTVIVHQILELQKHAEKELEETNRRFSECFDQAMNGGALAAGTMRRLFLPRVIDALHKAKILCVEVNGASENIYRMKKEFEEKH